ncbi:hypothetical protein ENSA7_09300 [Enhygromyxa salina]|uniref:Uncharacterized protein n=1 Tax=Enhygromyxa salina TaxID=215803 RepID=A0A2S9YW53_9BACT|nr:hypothetical protein ENSA7_09300 [Enhygromyxa salina]
MQGNTFGALLLLVPLLLGCGRAPVVLPDEAREALARGPEDHAQRVYVGTVVPQGGGARGLPV